MATQLMPRPVEKSVSLFDLEDDLLAMLNTEEMVPADQEAGFLVALSEQLQKTVEKRDRVAQFLRFCEAQEAFAADEMKRLQERKAVYANTRERIKKYVVGIIRALGVDEKGAYRKLVGQVASLRIQRNAAGVEIHDEAKVPAEFKRVTLQMPLDLWARVMEQSSDALAVSLQVVEVKEIEIRKTAVKEAIDGGREVPGADLALDSFHLRY